MTVLDSALEYAGLGWHVFPCEPRGKRPLGAACPHGHKNASNDPDKIRAWFERYPDANIGVALAPSGLVALDVDGGDDSLDAVRAELTPTLRARTGSGGEHWIYARTAPDQAARKIRYRPGLDLLGDGYVVVSPSIHPSGGQYTWLPGDEPVAPLPAVLSRGFAPKAPQERVSCAEPGDFGPAAPELLEHAKALLREHGPSLREHGGDAHCYRAGAILIHDLALQHDEAMRLLLWWNGEFPENDWAPGKLETKLDNAKKYASGEYGAERVTFEMYNKFCALPNWVAFRVPPTSESGSWADTLAQAKADIDTAMKNAPVDGGCPPPLFEPAQDLLGRVFPPTAWLVNDLATEGGTLVISGEPKTGIKSWSLVEIAVAVATGTLAFGHFATGTAKRVAYFFAEDHGRAVRNRLRASLAARGLTEAPKGLFLQTRGRFLDVLADGDLALIVASVRALGGVELLILEPLRDIHGGEEDSSDDMREVMRRLRVLGEVLKCTLGVAHHNKKSADGGAGRDMRGSGAIHGSIDCGLYVGNPSGNGSTDFTNTVKSEIKGARSAGEFGLTLKIEDDMHHEAVRVTWTVRRQESDKPKKQADRDALDATRTAAIIKVLDGVTSITQENLIERLRLDGVEIADKAVKPLIGKLLKSEEVARHQDYNVKKESRWPLTIGPKRRGGGNK